MPVILATQEAEIGNISVQSQPRQIAHETLSQKNPSQEKGLVEWLKVYALSSSPSTAKKKKKDKTPFEIPASNSFQNIIRSGIAKPYANSLFSFLRNCCTIFLYQFKFLLTTYEFLISPHPHQHFFFFNSSRPDKCEVAYRDTIFIPILWLRTVELSRPSDLPKVHRWQVAGLGFKFRCSGFSTAIPTTPHCPDGWCAL
jgi:hypothetical protein